MKKILIIQWILLMWITNTVHAETPLAVLTKTSSACEINSNANPNSLILCMLAETELIDKYINYNLQFFSNVNDKKKEWLKEQKRILKQCQNIEEGLDSENIGYIGCIRNEHSRYNKELLKVRRWR